jgi:hypothetical protein
VGGLGAQVDVGDLHAGALTAPNASVEPEHHEGGVPPLGELGALAGLEQPAQLVVAEDRNLLLRHGRAADVPHG